MKRDLDLVREMMLALEADDRLNGRAFQNCFASQLFNMPDRNDDELAYHLMQIIDEGWIEGEYHRTSGRFAISRLTADGHDFIDATRKPDVWAQARTAVRAGGSETLRFAWDVARAIGRKEIERRIGEF